MTLRIKDPQAILDYGFSFASWLATGETIATGATWGITPTGGITIATNAFTATGWAAGHWNNGTTVMVALKGGTAGTVYTATVHVSTTEGREDDRSMEILVQQR